MIGSDFVNRKVQWNHDKNKTSIMNDVLSITNYYFIPWIVQYVKKNLDKTKPLYSEHIYFASPLGLCYIKVLP